MPRPNRPTIKSERGNLPGRGILISCLLAGAALAVAIVFGKSLLASWARSVAFGKLDDWSVTEARLWIDWSARLTAADGETELMRAVCYRRLGQMGRWDAALIAARRKGASDSGVQHELELGRIRSGELAEGIEMRLLELADLAISPHEVATAFLLGYLAREEFDKASVLLDAWEADYPGTPHVAYLRGVYRQHLDQPDSAIQQFVIALSRQPRHEPARLAIAQVLEAEDRLGEALPHYVDLLTWCPASEPGTVGLARLLRKIGRIEDARAALATVASRAEPSADAAIEMGQIEVDLGDYREARQWFERAGAERRTDLDILSAVATTASLAGEGDRAELLFDRYTAMAGASTRVTDLQIRLALNANDGGAVDELRKIHATLSGNAGQRRGTSGAETQNRRGDLADLTGSELYAFHCSACHGDDGGGNGRAARHLTPRPRDFRTARFRLASSLHGIPTLKDFNDVVRLGMPGTAMPAYDDLADGQRRLLAEEVLRLHREGVREQCVELLREEGEEIDESEIDRVTDQLTQPAAAVDLPSIGSRDSVAISRGKEEYTDLGCDHCHGDDGTGAWDSILFDDKGRPARARDLVHEPFKGGPRPEDVFLRLYVGMPGSPHPAAGNLPQERLVDLVQFCRSLSQEPKRTLTNHQQSICFTSREYLTAFGTSRPAGADETSAP